MIPFNKYILESESLNYLTECVSAGYLQGGGTFSQLCEEQISKITNLQNVFLTASCTQALEFSSLLIGLKSGDEVITPAFNFTSSVLAIANFGATPVFVDIDIRTKNISTEMIEEVVTPRTKAISVVNYAGIACDYETIDNIAKKYNLVIIEDNAHGFGGYYQNRPLGSFGNLSVHSFHETKNLSCGEGGFISINDPEFLEHSFILRDKGTNRKHFIDGIVEKYTWQGLGGSYLLAEPLSAILFGQLLNFEKIQRNRLRVWNSYFAGLKNWSENNNVGLPNIPEQNSNVAHMFYLLMPNLTARNDLLKFLKANGIDARFHFQALNISPAGIKYGKSPFSCDNAINLSECIVRLPLWNGMSDVEVNKVIEICNKFQV